MNFKKKKTGFTMLELLVVIAIIAFLAAILLPVIFMAKKQARWYVAQNVMNELKIATEGYYDDFRKFPPAVGDPDESQNLQIGSEIIWYYLMTKHEIVKHDATTGDRLAYGPYFKANEGHLVRPDQNGASDIFAFKSPLHGLYDYSRLYDEDGEARNFLFVDPGEDRELGGEIDKADGFIPDGSDNNNDGVADDIDNIYSDMQFEPANP